MDEINSLDYLLENNLEKNTEDLEDNENKEKKDFRTIKLIFSLLIIILIIGGLIFLERYLRTKSDWEKYFTISKGITVSSITGNRKQGTPLDEVSIGIPHDVYISFKNENESNPINKITLQNFQVLKSPIDSDIRIYEPNKNVKNLYGKDNKEILLNTGSVEYPLDLNEKENRITFRILNLNKIKTLVEKEKELSYEYSILKNKISNLDEIQIKISFNVLVDLEDGRKYLGNMQITVPENMNMDYKFKEESKNFNNLEFRRVYTE